MKNRMMDLVGQRYGRLTVVEASDKRDASRGMMWICRCDCGKMVTVRAFSLRAGDTNSCGCLRIDKARENIQHALAKNKEERPKEKEQIYQGDDYWMFGDHTAIERLKRMFY